MPKTFHIIFDTAAGHTFGQQKLRVQELQVN